MQRRVTLLAFLLAAGITLPVQAAAPSCVANAGVPPVIRAEGFSEQISDLVINCQGGTPTPLGQTVPQANVTIYMDTTITSRLVAANFFTEALLIVDEPASAVNPTRPMLNCGNNGAPDTVSPGICSIVSTGNPAITYDGTANGLGSALCDGLSGRPVANTYGCGRPNVFQGRLGTPNHPGQTNAVTFFNVPLDPPGYGTQRTFRVTNLRANATSLGEVNGEAVNYLVATIAISGQAFLIPNPQQIVAYIYTSGMASACPAPTISTIWICEGFPAGWRPKNFSFAVGGRNGVPGNTTLLPGQSYYLYSGGINYPPDIAQNVPGAIYNTESFFQWQNNSTNGPPFPNPPNGVGTNKTTQTNYPFLSVGFGGLNTGINLAGTADAGTRIAVKFTGIPVGGSVHVPSMLYLFQRGTSNFATGVMVRTSADASGAGPFTQISTDLTPDSATAFYEVLWADPFSQEQTSIPYTVLNSPPGTTVTASLSFAPVVADASSTQASLVPRFLTQLCYPNQCIGLSSPQGTNDGPGQTLITGPTSLLGPETQLVLRHQGVADISSYNLGVLPNNIGPFGSTTIWFNFDLTGAVPGMRDVVITPPMGAPVTLANRYTVLLPPPCNASWMAGTTQFTAGGGLGTLTIMSDPLPCGWSGSFSVPWITFPAFTPSSPQVLTYVVAPNLDPQSRTATLTGSGNPNIQVTQAGTGCTYSVSPGGPISVPIGGGSVTLTVTTQAGCPWPQTSTKPWITLNTQSTSTGMGTASYSISPNPGGARVGTVAIAFQNVTITQPGPPSTIGIYRSGLWQLDPNGTGVFESGQDKSFFLGFPGATQFVGDWNGDGRSKAGVYSNGYWFLDYDGNGVWDGGVNDKLVAWGWAGVTPIIGDWNGNGKTKIGVYSNGFWFLDYDGDYQWDGGVVDKQIGWGWAGVSPIVGDWNGDGKTKIGVYSNGFWFLDYDGNYVWDGGVADKQVGWGWAGVTPIVGDWNGDGKTKIGVYSGGYWYLDYDGNYLWEYPAKDQVWSLGWAGTTPMMGDWNGDGRTKAGAFINGFWYLDYNGNGVFDGSGTDRIFAFGAAGDVPVVGHW